MARRSSLLVSLAVASLFLGFAAALSATSFASGAEPLTGSAAALTAGSSNAVVASVTSSADAEQTDTAAVVARNLEEQPSGVSEANVELADADHYPGVDYPGEEDKGEGLAVESAPQLHGSNTVQEEPQAQPEISSTEVDEPMPVIRVGCGGVIHVRMFEPNILGGLMLRGRGNILFIRAFPRVALDRVETSGSDPASTEPGTPGVAADESYPFSTFEGPMRPRPLPFTQGVGPEGVARSMESLFTLAHPLSLFRENIEEMNQWQAARMHALAALHGQMIHRMLETSLEEPSATSAAGAAGTAGVVEGATAEQPRLERGLVGVPELDASTLGDMGPIEWNSTAVCGLVLLGLSVSLLLSMLLMGLSSVIYGTPEDEEDEKAAVRGASVQTPLLKFLQVEEEPDEKAATVNPVCKYEPPAEK